MRDGVVPGSLRPANGARVAARPGQRLEEPARRRARPTHPDPLRPRLLVRPRGRDPRRPGLHAGGRRRRRLPRLARAGLPVAPAWPSKRPGRARRWGRPSLLEVRGRMRKASGMAVEVHVTGGSSRPLRRVRRSAWAVGRVPHRAGSSADARLSGSVRADERGPHGLRVPGSRGVRGRGARGRGGPRVCAAGGSDAVRRRDARVRDLSPDRSH